MDDINNVYGLFGIGYIPHNVIIGGDGEVLYSDAGYNQTAIVSIIDQALEDLPSDLDEDGLISPDEFEAFWDAVGFGGEDDGPSPDVMFAICNADDEVDIV